MFSEKDFERLWFLYKTEGEPKGVSINSFCIGNNIPYTAFYDWFKMRKKKYHYRNLQTGRCLLQGLFLQTTHRIKKVKNGLRKPSSHDNMQIIIVKFR